MQPIVRELLIHDENVILATQKAVDAFMLE